MATPLIAGAAGLLLSSQPSATAVDLANALESGADRATDSRYGRLDVAGALDALATVRVAVAPVLLAPPLVTGLPVRGGTLNATPGTWSGGAAAYAYQWLRCTTQGGVCDPIPGATAAGYRITPADLGRLLEVQVTAVSGYGQVVARSSGVAVPAVRTRVSAMRRR